MDPDLGVQKQSLSGHCSLSGRLKSSQPMVVTGFILKTSGAPVLSPEVSSAVRNITALQRAHII